MDGNHGTDSRASVRAMLRTLPMFAALDAAALERVAAGASDVATRSRTVLFRRGDAYHGFYIVISGQVKLSLETARGGEQIVEIVGPGGTIGEIGLLLDSVYLLTAETLADTRLIRVTGSTMLAELGRASGLARGLFPVLGRRLRHLIGTLEDCTLRSGTERVIRYLLSQLPPGASAGGAAVYLPASKGIIASQLNLTQEHFSRILRALVVAALIEVDGRTVLIPDVGRLRSCADSSRSI